MKLNSNALKLIAIIAMTLDHVADLLYPGMQSNIFSIILHIIGRLTAPIMFFFICEGFYYTKNIKKYILRLFIFSIISHFAYCFAFGINYIPFRTGNIFNQTSIMWTLAWAVVGLFVIYGNNKLSDFKKRLMIILINIITFCSDWSSIAVMAIISMYPYRGNLKKQFNVMSFWILIYGLISYLFVNKTYGLITLGFILVYPLLSIYNGEKGKQKWMKWFFYLYYPLHLVIIGVIRLIIYGNISLLFNV